MEAKLSYKNLVIDCKRDGREKFTSKEYYDTLGWLMGCTRAKLKSIAKDDNNAYFIQTMAYRLSEKDKDAITIEQLIKLMDYMARTEDRELNAQYRTKEFELRKEMIKKPELTQSIDEDRNDIPIGLLMKIEEVTDEYYGVPKEKPDLSKYTRKKAVDRSDQESET